LTAAVKVRYEKIANDAKVPARATSQSACYDVYASEDTNLPPFESTMVHTGIKVQCEPGYCVLVFPRSGLAAKQGITLSNSVGVIDSDYSEELLVSLFNRNSIVYEIKKHDRIAQLQLIKLINIVWIEGLVSGSRSGFGSTGS
jgi:dUTP pyrophosphatase